MKAIVQDRFGSADVLELRDIPDPVVGPDDASGGPGGGMRPRRVAHHDREAVLRPGDAGVPEDEVGVRGRCCRPRRGRRR